MLWYVLVPSNLLLRVGPALAHHGWARPLVKSYDPDQVPSLSVPLAREAALRFARLQAAWGPWGLAWWETLLRAADWAASRALNDSAEATDHG